MPSATNVTVLQPHSVYALATKSQTETGFLPLCINKATAPEVVLDDSSSRYAALPVDEVDHFLLCTGRAASVVLPRGVTLDLVAEGATAALHSLKLRIFSRDAIQFDQTGGLTAYPLPPNKVAARAFHKSLKIARLLDLSPERTVTHAERQLVLGWGDNQGAGPTRPEENDTPLAIVLHLHYTDLWPQFAGCLAKIERSFSLFVTLNAADPVLESTIKQQFPTADIRIVPNFGRDLGPFFTLLDDGSLDGFELVCKLHGKKSLRAGRPTLLGWSWLQRSMMELLGSPERIDQIVAQFQSDERLGLVGPSAFRIPNKRFPEKDAWGGNREVTLAMAERVANRARNPMPFTLDFFAGTMFWFRPPALASLRGMGLSDLKTYATEAGRIDGALEHALERVLPYAALCAGFSLGTVPPVP